MMNLRNLVIFLMKLQAFLDHGLPSTQDKLLTLMNKVYVTETFFCHDCANINYVDIH